MGRKLLKSNRVLVTNCFCLALYAQTITGLPLTATATLVNSKVKAGRPITVVVTLKNTSQESFAIVHTSPLRDYQIDVRDFKGAQVERTPHGRSVLHPPDIIGRIVKKTLLPGESVRDELELDLAFVLTAPGTYSVSVSRVVADANNRAKTFVITAPVVSFTIE
jgi:hypothetical protein